MNSTLSQYKALAAALAGLSLVACSSITSTDEEDFATLPPQSVVLNGTISGLGVSSLVLQNNGAGNRSFSSTSTLSMGAVPVGSSYNITVLTHPQGRTCQVANGSGVANGPVSDITVTCALSGEVPAYYLSGTVTGDAATAPGLQVRLTSPDGSETIPVPAGQTTFAFAMPMFSLYNYTVTATTTSGAATNSCSVVNGTGAIASANITNVEVNSCVFTVGGSVASTGAPLVLGSGGVTVALRDRAGAQLETVNVPAIGSFVFPTTRVSNAQARYTAAIISQPADQTCLLRNAGTVNLTVPGNINLAIACQPNPVGAENTVTGTYQLNTPAGTPTPPRPRNFLTFFADGTFIYGVHGATADTSGVEHGFYSLNCCGPGSAFFVLTTDSNGTATGLSGLPGAVFGSPFGSAFTKTAGPPATLSITFGAGAPGTVVLAMTEVTATPGQVNGAWGSNDRLRQLVYSSADDTVFHAAANGVANVQDMCLIMSNPLGASGTYLQDRSSICRPGTLAVIDTAPSWFLQRLPGTPPSLTSAPQTAPEPVNFAVTAGPPETLTLQETYQGTVVGSPVTFTRSVVN